MESSICTICGHSNFLCSDLESRLLNTSEVRQAFKDQGLTITHWAERHDVHRGSVYQVLYKKHRSYRGNAHAIAVLLRLKSGDINEFNSKRTNDQRAAETAQ